jgi:hypothetical protein
LFSFAHYLQVQVGCLHNNLAGGTPAPQITSQCGRIVGNYPDGGKSNNTPPHMRVDSISSPVFEFSIWEHQKKLKNGLSILGKNSPPRQKPVKHALFAFFQDIRTAKKNSECIMKNMLTQNPRPKDQDQKPMADVPLIDP